MGRNKKKYVREPYALSGFCYKNNNQLIDQNDQTLVDHFMEENGFAKDVVYSENKNKRWNFRERLISEVSDKGSKENDELSIIYEVDAYKPTETSFVYTSKSQPKRSRVNIRSKYNELVGNNDTNNNNNNNNKRVKNNLKQNVEKNKKSTPLTSTSSPTRTTTTTTASSTTTMTMPMNTPSIMSTPTTTILTPTNNKEKNKKPCSIVVFAKDVYCKKNSSRSNCCRDDQAKEKIRYRNEKKKAFSECAYDYELDDEDLVDDEVDEEEEEKFKGTKVGVNENEYEEDGKSHDLYKDELKKDLRRNAENTIIKDKLRPMSIEICSIFNDMNNSLRFKPKDPDLGFEIIDIIVK